MKKLIIILFLIFLIPTTSHALTRWGNNIVYEGEYSCVILQKCGQPIHKEIIRKGIKYSKIEHWLYEKGDGYYYIFIFKGGILTKVKSIRK